MSDRPPRRNTVDGLARGQDVRIGMIPKSNYRHHFCGAFGTITALYRDEQGRWWVRVQFIRVIESYISHEFRPWELERGRIVWEPETADDADRRDAGGG